MHNKRLHYVATFALAVSAFLHTSTVAAAPPEVPPKLSAKVGAPVLFDVKVEKGKTFGYASGFDKSRCVVVRLYSEDPEVASFMAIPASRGEYYVTFWTRGEKELGSSQTIISAEDGALPPPVKPVDPPPVVPPPIAKGLYFLVVGSDAPGVDPAITASLSLPEWNQLKAAGHLYNYKTAKEAAALGFILPADALPPRVFISRTRADGKSEILAVAPLPRTGVGILALPGFVK